MGGKNFRSIAYACYENRFVSKPPLWSENYSQVMS
jgi:hypothetical protein